MVFRAPYTFTEEPQYWHALPTSAFPLPVESNPSPSLLFPAPPAGVLVCMHSFICYPHDDEILIMTHLQGAVISVRDASLAAPAVRYFRKLIGHRRIFPGEAWKLEPEFPVTLDVEEKKLPAEGVRVFYSYGNTPERNVALQQWVDDNYPQRKFEVRSQHAGDVIFKAHQAEFAAHPEYLALIDGVRVGRKFCLSSEGVIDLLARYAQGAWDRSVANGNPGTVSLSPTDGQEGNDSWCECEACVAMGPPQDRVAKMLHGVLALVRDDVKLATTAYGAHADAPSALGFAFPAGRVYVAMSTRFDSTTAPAETVKTAWQALGATVGFRCYSGLWSQYYDTPMRYGVDEDNPFALENNSNLEMTDSWIRYLPAVREDDVRRLFPNMFDAMLQFRCTNLALYHESERDAVQMHRLADEAFRASDNIVEAVRLAHALDYTRYLVAMHRWKKARAGGRHLGDEWNQLVSVVKSVADGVVHSEAWRDDINRLNPLSPQLGDVPFSAFAVPSAQFTPSERFAWLSVQVNAQPLAKDIIDFGEGRRVFDRVTGTMFVAAGLREHKPTLVSLMPGMYEYAVQPGEVTRIDVRDAQVIVTDNGGGTSITFKAGSLVELRPNLAPHLARRTFKFNVDQIIGGCDMLVLWHLVGNGTLVSPSGKAYVIPKRYPDYLEVPAEDGVWTCKDVIGVVELMDGDTFGGSAYL